MPHDWRDAPRGEPWDDDAWDDDAWDDGGWGDDDGEDRTGGRRGERYDRSVMVRAVAALVAAAMILVVLGSVVGFARGGDGGGAPATTAPTGQVPVATGSAPAAASPPLASTAAAPTSGAPAAAPPPPVAAPTTASAAPAASPEVTGSGPPATSAVADPVPEVDAAAYVVYDTSTGQFLAERAADEQRPVGSVIKLLTAWVAMQAGDPADTAVAPPTGLVIDPDESQIGIFAGQTLTREVLLRAMLIVSANDAARLLALDVAGSEAAFVEQMNRAADELGLAGTVAVNPVGLDADGAVATARDMALLGALLMQDETFRTTVARTTASLNGVTLEATNDLLRTYPGADGVKTGRTTQAGWCLVGSATRDGRRVLVVVLGAPSDEARLRSATALLDWAFARPG